MQQPQINGSLKIMHGKNRPTILFINHWAHTMGGAEHSLLDMLSFIASEAECHLVTVEPGILVEKAEQSGVKCHIVPCPLKTQKLLRKNIIRTMLTSLPDILAYIRYVFSMRLLVRHIKPQVIHANVPKSHITLFLLQKFGYRKTCCFHIREIFERDSLPWKIYRLLFSKKQSVVLAISNHVFDMLPAKMQKAARVVYNGVFIRPAWPLRTRHNLQLKLCYVGRIVPWKGCEYLVEVVAYIKRHNPSAKVSLSLIGDTAYWPQGYRDELRALIQRSNLEEACFLFPNTTDVDSAYSTHHVFVNASHQEPFGRSIAEAQGAGLPVIAFESGALSEIVENGETGYLVPYGDVPAMATMVLKLYCDPELCESLGANGRLRALRLFNRDIQLPLLYKTIIGQVKNY